MKKRVVITEARVLAAERAGQKLIECPDDAVITPLARDIATAKGIAFGVSPKAQSVGPVAPPPQTIVVGSDHGGLALKRELEPFLRSLGWRVTDVGTNSEASCDYPDFAYAVARAVSSGVGPIGLMIDGAGPGSAIVCNKVPGVRAVAAASEFVAWNARAHNDCNVLTLGSRVTGSEVCKRIVKVFLETPFEGGRHSARVAKISDIERHFAHDE